MEIVKVLSKGGARHEFIVTPWDDAKAEHGYSLVMGFNDQNKLRWALAVLLNFGIERTSMAVFRKDGQYMLAHYALTPACESRAGYFYGIINAAMKFKAKNPYRARQAA